MAETLGLYGQLSSIAYNQYVADYNSDVAKSYITGSQIVTPTDDADASALRKQFLVDNLVNTLYGSDLDLFMKHLPVVKVNSPLVEFSRLDVIGGAGDGFVPETGSDGNFGVPSGDDAFSRHTRTVKFMAAQRNIGDIASNTNNLKELKSLAKQNATLELIRNSDVATFWGHSGLNNLMFDGIEKQILDWVDERSDPEILIDMNNGTIGIEHIKLGVSLCMYRFGNPSVLVQSIGAHHATEQTVFSQLRGPINNTDGRIASNFNEVTTQAGKIMLKQDIMLRENRPAIFSGPGSTGKPNLVADADSWAFAVDPFVTTTGVAAGSAGTGSYWQYRSLNTMSAVATKPAVPVASGRRNNVGNRLAAGSYYYAIEAVVNGKRNVTWVWGAASAGTLTSAAAVAVTLGQVVTVTLKAIGTAFGGAYVASKAKQVYFRLYRTAALGSAPTDFNQFDLLGTFSYTAESTPTANFYDNGMLIPGTTTSFLLTEKRDGRQSVVFAEFMDMYYKELAVQAMSQPFAMFLFGTPIVFFGGHHVIYYNVKPYNTI